MSMVSQMHDRRDGVEEGQRVSPVSSRDRLGQRRRGEGAGGDDRRCPNRPAAGRRLPRASIVISGCASSAAVTAAEKPSRSTASAPPAGTWLASAAAHDQRAQPAHLGMQQADRVGLRRRRSGRSWSRPVRPGRRSCARRSAHRAHLVQDDGHAGLAICQAASEPARPPPMTWTVSVWGVEEIMRAGLARFHAKRTYHSVFERSGRRYA